VGGRSRRRRPQADRRVPPVLPVDDLLVHDDALVHLLVIGPTSQLWHLHPIPNCAGPLPAAPAVCPNPVIMRYRPRWSVVAAVCRGSAAATGLTAIAASRPDALATGAAANPVHLGNGSLAVTTPVGATSVSLTTTQTGSRHPCHRRRPLLAIPATCKLWLGMVRPHDRGRAATSDQHQRHRDCGPVGAGVGHTPTRWAACWPRIIRWLAW